MQYDPFFTSAIYQISCGSSRCGICPESAFRQPVSNFEDHAGPLTEMVLAGNLALRLGQKIDWDAANLEVRGIPEAQKIIRRAYRAGWESEIS